MGASGPAPGFCTAPGAGRPPFGPTKRNGRCQQGPPILPRGVWAVLAPYAQPRPHREVAWLLSPERALAEDGNEVALPDLLEAGVQVWARSEQLREYVRQGHGSCVLWRYQAIGWHPDRQAKDWPVRGLALEAPDAAADCLEGVMLWRDWLERYGAAPAGSLGGSGFSLLRATLPGKLWTSVGDVPPIKFALGGRQEVAQPVPAHYICELRQCDIPAAYAQVLGGTAYGGRWQRFDFGPRTERIAERAAQPIYYRAEVQVPDLPGLESLRTRSGPLVVRPRSQPSPTEALFWQREEDAYPAGRTIQGTWSLPEIRAAEASGCRVRRVRDVWIHLAEDRPFTAWLEAVWGGRAMKGFASRLAKATGNATWGQFAIAKGRRKVVAEGRDELLPLRGGNPSQRAFDLAEWIAGTVRADLYRGMTHAGPALVCAHTDGLWTRGSAVPRWRVTGEATELRIFDAQCYAYRVEEQPWQYTVAGVLSPAEAFEALWARAQAAGTPTPLELRAGQLARAAANAVPVLP